MSMPTIRTKKILWPIRGLSTLESNQNGKETKYVRATMDANQQAHQAISSSTLRRHMKPSNFGAN
eukprot:scaffold1558_cov199-Alexandrium_tamarense.AAC.5